MARSSSDRFHVSMNLSQVDDQWRHATIASVLQLAPTSPLFAVPSIQASITALGTLGASLKMISSP